MSQTPSETTPYAEDFTAPLDDRVAKALTALGVENRVVEPGQVAFKVGETVFAAQCVDRQPELLRIFAAWPMGQVEPRTLLRRLVACNDVNGALLTVKVGITENTFVASGEHVVFPGVDLRALVILSANEVATGLEAVQKRLAELDAADPQTQPGG